MTPAEFHKRYTGWGKDVDGVAGVQCVDLFKEFLRIIGCPTWRSAIGGDGYADNIWYNRTRWKDYFMFVSKGQYQDGDIVLFPHSKRGGRTHPHSHVCFFYSPNIEFGTNQGGDRKARDLKADYSDSLGGLRWKGWSTMVIKDGYSVQSINNHNYKVYKQSADEAAAVLSAGANKTVDFKEMDSGKNLQRYAQIANGNFFQLAENQSDPYGTTYGDVVAPIQGVYFILPNQQNNLWYDLDTASYGNVKGYYPQKTHNVFSPALVFHGSSYSYAPMVGSKHNRTVSTFTGILHCTDGKYAMILSSENTTPQAMWDDWKDYGDSLAILDGGGSAQMGCWDGSKYIYPRYTGRAIASEVIFYKTGKTEVKPVKQDDELAKLRKENAELKAKLLQIKEIAS